MVVPIMFECSAHAGGFASMSPPDRPLRLARGSLRDRLRHAFALIAFGIGVVLSVAWAALLGYIFFELAIDLLF